MSLLEEREVNGHRYYFTINIISVGQGATPGTPDRQESAQGQVTDYATRPVGIYRTYTVFMSISFHFVWSKGTLELASCILLLIFHSGH